MSSGGVRRFAALVVVLSPTVVGAASSTAARSRSAAEGCTVTYDELTVITHSPRFFIKGTAQLLKPAATIRSGRRDHRLRDRDADLSPTGG